MEVANSGGDLLIMYQLTNTELVYFNDDQCAATKNSAQITTGSQYRIMCFGNIFVLILPSSCIPNQLKCGENSLPSSRCSACIALRPYSWLYSGTFTSTWIIFWREDINLSIQKCIVGMLSSAWTPAQYLLWQTPVHLFTAKCLSSTKLRPAFFLLNNGASSTKLSTTKLGRQRKLR